MRSLKIALLGVIAATGFGALASAPAQAQEGFGPGRVYSVSRPLPIRVRPRSWLDAGNVVEANNGSVSNPATNPQFITASYLNSPPYGRNDRFGGGILPDPITNGPFIGARSTAVRNVDLSFVDRLDPTSPLYGRPY